MSTETTRRNRDGLIRKGPEADLYPMGWKRGNLQGPKWLQSTSKVMQGNSRTARQVPRRLGKNEVE